MNGIESLLLNGAQQQHHYYSNNGGAVSKEMGSFDYHSGASSEVQNRTQFEADKQAVYRHPLFPLLALLLEKCEEATRGDQDTRVVLGSLEEDVRAFIQHGKDGNKKLTTENPEVDGLMLKALQVLRIHLLELEKVQELCRDFCKRYIACLRGKLHSENLLRLEGEGNNADADEGGYESNGSNSSMSSHRYNLNTVAASFSGNRVDSNSVSQPAPRSSHVPYNAPPSSLSTDDEDEHLGSGGGNSTSNSAAHKVKRGVLPRKATTVLRSWLFQHLVHPYPTEEEKRQLAAQTKLTLLQVNNWFINARRRILQPMLDSAHSAPGTGHTALPSSEFPSTSKRLQRISGNAGSSSGPGSDGEDALSYGDSDQ